MDGYKINRTMVKKVAIAMGLTKTSLAKAANVSWPTARNFWEGRPVSIGPCKKIVEAVGLTMDNVELELTGAIPA